jgi:energy-coupling factor transporter transmembrane protein EcfT
MNALHPASNAGMALRAAIVGLTIATGWIHVTLGSPLFTLNAIGYFAAALAMVAPIALAVRFRWFIRLGLIGYAATAIVAWFLMGPRYDVAYVAKAIEVGLIALLAVEVRAYDANPLRRIRQALRPSAGA